MTERSAPPAEFMSGARMATDKQLAYIKGLAEDRQMSDDHRSSILARVEAREVTFDRARDWIPRLKALPMRTQPTSDWTAGDRIKVQYEEHELDDGKNHRIGYITGAGEHRIPRGRYALESAGADWANDTTFFKVWVGERGGWSIKVQASDEEYAINKWETKLWVLREIAKDPEAALRRYGRELGKCGICGRTLTNDLSRELGIGPVCRTKL
jgi:hypothetical protein